MLPLAMPLAFQLDIPMAVCIGAVISGGIFGDHCSPISDTTILSSTGAGCDHKDHNKTQIPIALFNGIITFATLLVTSFINFKFSILFAIVFMVLGVFLFNKMKLKTSNN
ncbi:Na+/H+ antiporter NhaC family protein [Staphylococcus ureilyticus]